MHTPVSPQQHGIPSNGAVTLGARRRVVSPSPAPGPHGLVMRWTQWCIQDSNYSHTNIAVMYGQGRKFTFFTWVFLYCCPNVVLFGGILDNFKDIFF